MADHPKPRTEDELLAAIRDALTFDLPADAHPDRLGSATLGSHYEASAQALVTCAAFEYAAHAGAVTGFQASWALMQILWRGNRWDGPGLIIKAEDNLYPQYPAPEVKAREWAESDDVRRWLRDRARELLAQRRGGITAGVVADHWLTLAATDVPEREGAADGA